MAHATRRPLSLAERIAAGTSTTSFNPIKRAVDGTAKDGGATPVLDMGGSELHELSAALELPKVTELKGLGFTFSANLSLTATTSPSCGRLRGGKRRLPREGGASARVLGAGRGGGYALVAQIVDGCKDEAKARVECCLRAILLGDTSRSC